MEDKAREVLKRLRGTDPNADIDEEIKDVKEAQEKESSTTVRDLWKPNIRPLIWIGVGLAVFQQFVGINTVEALSESPVLWRVSRTSPRLPWASARCSGL